jgi:hypothetical protein
VALISSPSAAISVRPGRYVRPTSCTSRTPRIGAMSISPGTPSHMSMGGCRRRMKFPSFHPGPANPRNWEDRILAAPPPFLSAKRVRRSSGIRWAPQRMPGQKRITRKEGSGIVESPCPSDPPATATRLLCRDRLHPTPLRPKPVQDILSDTFDQAAGRPASDHITLMPSVAPLRCNGRTVADCLPVGQQAEANDSPHVRATSRHVMECEERLDARGVVLVPG